MLWNIKAWNFLNARIVERLMGNDRSGRQKNATSLSSAIASAQIGLQTIPKETDTCDSERYWECQSVYHIPAPQGIIEQWEDEDKKRWEPINIGDSDRSEADRQIKIGVTLIVLIDNSQHLLLPNENSNLLFENPHQDSFFQQARSTRGFTRARNRENRESRAQSRKDVFFIVSLICFGLQITFAAICIAFCMLRIIDGGHIQAGIVFFLLASLPLFGAVGGILSAVTRSETLGLCTAIYNIASAVAIIVATINVYSFQLYQLFSFNVFIPLASAVAFVQTASFGIVLIIYFKLSTAAAAAAAAADYSRCIIANNLPLLMHRLNKDDIMIISIINNIDISNAKVRRSGRRSHRKQMELKARKRAEQELQAKTDDVTRKYKEKENLEEQHAKLQLLPELFILL
ncbi:unnamed protein product [Onchocerca flexuosa]|uniref:Uncharacterized protein n=1 Tax=Onchocerca flexuosa TaxID=387005 RepID=A0A183HY97_9BILA|nr:unnamed protein product [Onchocerca flexuosa]